MNSSEVSSASAVDKSGEKVQQMFAQIAPRYDMMNHLLSLGIDIRWRKRVVSKLRIESDLPILDCCTGTGDLALLIAKRVNGRVPVIGSDFCGQMLDIARVKGTKTAANLPVQFLEADAQQLPFDDGSFQTVTIAFGLRNVQDTIRGLHELTRVCAPGGQVAILEFSQPSVFGLKQLYRFYFQRVLPRVGQRMAKNDHSAYSYLPSSVLEFPCGQKLAEMMTGIGLTNVSYIPFTFGVATLYLGDKPA